MSPCMPATKFSLSALILALSSSVSDVREPSLAPGLTLPNDLPQAPRAFWLQATYRL